MEVIREELEQGYVHNSPMNVVNWNYCSSGWYDFEDLVAQEDVVSGPFSRRLCGDINRLPTTKHNVGGGKGKSATKMKGEDFIEKTL